MRPRPIPRKTRRHDRRRKREERRFNEAAADTAENGPRPGGTTPASRRFNEAAADTAENEMQAQVTWLRTFRGFNEAAADTAENAGWRPAGAAATTGASMRPRPIPRKTSGRRCRPRAASPRFNEAAADTAENGSRRTRPRRPGPRFNEAAADTAENV